MNNVNDERRETLKATLRYWLYLILTFNILIAALHLYYHEDLLGHILRYFDFVVLFTILMNGCFAAAMLPELYLYIFRGKNPGRLRHPYRIAAFLIILFFFAHAFITFYGWHPVPHTSEGGSFMSKP